MGQKARHPGEVTDVGEAARPVIAESWRRSLAARVDPDRHEAPVVYGPDEIADLRGTHPLAAALPLLKHTLSMDDTIMIVTDTGGHILWCEGDNRVRHSAERVHLTEGSRWSEDVIGTNAMGLAKYSPLAGGTYSPPMKWSYRSRYVTTLPDCPGAAYFVISPPASLRGRRCRAPR